MENEFKKIVNKKVKEIQKEVYIRDDILRKIVSLFLSIKDGIFPSKKPPKGLLFYGPPGTGKTLLMKTLAKSLELSEPIMIRGPEIISQYYGKSEARLRQIFMLAKDRAEEENLAIIFIDELDSLTPRRDITRGELEPRLVGQILSLMDGLDKDVSRGHVIVIGSTNRPETLDPALRRPGRFDLEIEFDSPNVDERKEILKILINNYSTSQLNINLDEIAEQTIGFTGADLLQLLNESLLDAALEGRRYIKQEHLLNAKKRVKPSALREFYIEKPKDKTDKIKNENFVNKTKQIAEEFLSKPCFKPVLLYNSLSTSDKIASTIAYLVHQKLNCPYLVVKGTWFRTRWFGEMERSIREVFGKISRLQPCVVYIKNIEAIANLYEEHLYGATLELFDNLSNFIDCDVEALFLCSIKDISKLDKEFIDYFEDIIGESHIT